MNARTFLARAGTSQKRALKKPRSALMAVLSAEQGQIASLLRALENRDVHPILIVFLTNAAMHQVVFLPARRQNAKA
jgi:hypothetical protein